MVIEAKMRTVMYVEDDEDIAELFKLKMVENGYAVDIANTGETAIKMQSQRNYDVIVLDQNLPRMSGLEVLESITAQASHPPIIMLTMLMHEDLVIQALQIGASDFVVKDVSGGYLKLMPVMLEKVIQQREIELEKVKAEANVRRVARRFQHLVENISDIIGIINVQGKVTYLSPSVKHILGYAPSALQNSADYIHPDDLPRTRQILLKIIKEPDFMRSDISLRVKHQDGSWRWMEGTVTDLLNEATINGIVVNLHDVTEIRQAQQVLEKERNIFRTLVHAIPAYIYIKDREGRIQIGNQALSNFLGLSSPDVMIGKTTVELLGEDSAPLHKRDLEIMETQETVVNEEELINDNWYITNKIPLVQNGGEVDGLVAIRQDINERKAYEQEILRHNHRLLALHVASSSIAESLSMPDVVSAVIREIVQLTDFHICTISRWDQEENYVQAIMYHDKLNVGINDWSERYYLKDYPRTEQVLNDWDIIQQVISDPELDEAERRYMKENGVKSYVMIPIVYQNQAIAIAELEDTRFERKLDAEELLPVELLLHQAGIAFENARLYEHSQAEIKERERAENALKESEASFRIMFEMAPIGIYLMTMDGSLNRINQAFANLIGYSADELVGQNLSMVVHEDDIDISTLLPDHASDEQYQVEQRYIHKDGHTVYALLRAKWLFTNIKEPFYLMGQVVDITERKMAEEELNNHLQQLELLHQIDGEISQTLNIQSVLILALDTIIRFSYADLGYVALYEGEKLIIAEYMGISDKDLKGLVLESTSITSRVATRAEAELIPDVTTDPAYVLLSKHTKAQISLPLASSGRMIGVLGLETQQADQFTQERFEFLKLIAGRISAAVDNAQLFDQTQEQLETLTSLHKQLVYQAMHDPLTGLPNRAYFHKSLDENISKAHSTKKRVGLLYMDLDGFKRVNDTMGHPVGDILLQQVARRLKQTVRESDVVARMGGDEFTVIVSMLEELDDAKIIAHRILDSLREPYYIQGQKHFISASIGMSFYPTDGFTTEDLLRKADNALYNSKDAGKNTFQMYDTIVNRKVFEQVAIGNLLHGVIERGEFEVHYQPQVDMQTGKVIGAEALLRWPESDLGAVPPSKFLPIASDLGLVIPISNWVVETVCKQQREWQQAGFDIMLSVNIAIPQFQKPDFVTLISQLLQTQNLDPATIELEVTEELMLDNLDAAAKKIEELRVIGVKIALDDFGTGYSSLSYLQKLQIDTLKLDRSLVVDIDGSNNVASSKSKAIIAAIISLAKSLSVKVIAEGVETEIQRDVLKDAGVDIAQGFLISNALAAAEFEEWLRNYTPQP